VGEIFKNEIVQRITRNLLDVQILRLIQPEPMWGYKIKKQAEVIFGVKLRHGALYPLLSRLEKESFVTGQKRKQDGRTRKVYSITQKGENYIQAYYNVIREQMSGKDLK
jgi:PadR family transcriptional regulator PadR